MAVLPEAQEATAVRGPEVAAPALTAQLAERARAARAVRAVESGETGETPRPARALLLAERVRGATAYARAHRCRRKSGAARTLVAPTERGRAVRIGEHPRGGRSRLERASSSRRSTGRLF